MDSGNLTLTAWGYGLTGLGYSFFALRLSQLGYLREPRERSRTSLLAAIATTALWGWFGVAFMLTGVPVLLVLSTLLDSVRYGCWFTFLGALVRGDRKSSMPAKGDLLGSIAIAMVAASILTVFRFLWIVWPVTLPESCYSMPWCYRYSRWCCSSRYIATPPKIRDGVSNLESGTCRRISV